MPLTLSASYPEPISATICSISCCEKSGNLSISSPSTKRNGSAACRTSFLNARLQDGWLKARAGLEAGRRQRPALRGPEAAAQQARRGGHLGGKRKKGEGVEDRNEGTMEELEEPEEQRALYTRAKRRGGALPDRAGLNPKRQRTGTDSTTTVINPV